MIIHVSDALFFRDDIFRVHDLPTDFDKSNTTCVTSGAGTAYLSGAPEVILVFNEVRVAQSLVFCVVLYRLPLCCLSFDLRLLINPFGIFKLFLYLSVELLTITVYNTLTIYFIFVLYAYWTLFRGVSAKLKKKRKSISFIMT